MILGVGAYGAPSHGFSLQPVRDLPLSCLTRSHPFRAVIGWFLVSLAFSYYHQILSPQPIPPSQAYAMGNFGMNNPNQPYNPSAGYHYPAPSGPPPQQQEYVPPYDPAKLPEYGAGSYGASTASVGDVKAGGQANSSREDVSFHSPAAPGRNA